MRILKHLRGVSTYLLRGEGNETGHFVFYTAIIAFLIVVTMLLGYQNFQLKELMLKLSPPLPEPIRPLPILPLPTTISSPVATESLELKSRRQLSSQIEDESFYKFLLQVKPLIDSGNFAKLSQHQELTRVSCDPQEILNPSLCKGVATKEVRSGYQIGYNQSEADVLSQSEFLKLLSDYFVNNGPFVYQGIIAEKEKGAIVYLNEKEIPDERLFVLMLKKRGEVWKISYVMLGVTSDDFVNLDKVILNYLEFGY